jgi:hypothetical protein
MTAEEVLRFKNAAPFRPFEMLLADGRALPIPHPDFISVVEANEMAHLFDSSDGEEAIDLMLVVSLRVPLRTIAAPRKR